MGQRVNDARSGHRAEQAGERPAHRTRKFGQRHDRSRCDKCTQRATVAQTLPHPAALHVLRTRRLRESVPCGDQDVDTTEVKAAEIMGNTKSPAA